MSYGHGDPSISPAAQRAHDLADRKEETGYIDPETGYMVMTVFYLKQVEACCAMDCRHCPYPAHEQKRAGRRQIRPV